MENIFRSQVFTIALFLAMDFFSLEQVWARTRDLTFMTPYLLILLAAVLTISFRAWRLRTRDYFAKEIAPFAIGLLAAVFAGNEMLIAVLKH